LAESVQDDAALCSPGHKNKRPLPVKPVTGVGVYRATNISSPHIDVIVPRTLTWLHL